VCCSACVFYCVLQVCACIAASAVVSAACVLQWRMLQSALHYVLLCLFNLVLQCVLQSILVLLRLLLCLRHVNCTVCCSVRCRVSFIVCCSVHCSVCLHFYTNCYGVLLRLVGSLKLWVSFAEYSLCYRDFLQKRPIIFKSLYFYTKCYYVYGLNALTREGGEETGVGHRSRGNVHAHTHTRKNLCFTRGEGVGCPQNMSQEIGKQSRWYEWNTF